MDAFYTEEQKKEMYIKYDKRWFLWNLLNGVM
jgi:hypothetical protein